MKKMTLKNLFESIDGLKVEAKKAYVLSANNVMGRNVGRNTRVFVISGVPATTTGDEIYNSLLDTCHANNAIFKRNEAGALVLRFYYPGEWKDVESRILKKGLARLKIAENSLYRELFEQLENVIDSYKTQIKVPFGSEEYDFVENDLKILKDEVKKFLVEKDEVHRELFR